MIQRLGKALVGVTISALALTGCTPPMPPEVRAALAEQSYTCVAGEATVGFPYAATDLAVQWQDSLSIACPEMSFSALDDTEASDVLIDAYGVDVSDVYASVPFALDATVVVVNMAGLSGVNLSAGVIERILSGEITSWVDPAIKADNPGLELTDEPIVLDNRIQKNAIASFSAWMKRLNGGSFDASKFKAVDRLTVDDAYAVPEGGLAFLPYSVNAEAMLVSAAIITDAKHPIESAVIPESATVASAAGQLKVSKSGSEVSVELDPNRKPAASAGQDQALTPYQAVYPVTMVLRGSDNLTARAVARFLLRQDSQGILAASFLLPIPETVRVETLAIIEKGLPEPELPEPTE